MKNMVESAVSRFLYFDGPGFNRKKLAFAEIPWLKTYLMTFFWIEEANAEKILIELEQKIQCNHQELCSAVFFRMHKGFVRNLGLSFEQGEDYNIFLTRVGEIAWMLGISLYPSQNSDIFNLFSSKKTSFFRRKFIFTRDLEMFAEQNSSLFNHHLFSSALRKFEKHTMLLIEEEKCFLKELSCKVFFFILNNYLPGSGSFRCSSWMFKMKKLS
jgi:hypothetical protein